MLGRVKEEARETEHRNRSAPVPQLIGKRQRKAQEWIEIERHTERIGETDKERQRDRCRDRGRWKERENSKESETER